MKNRKNKLFSFVGLISIIFFAILVFIFSSLFAIKQDELQEEYTTIQLGALIKKQKQEKQPQVLHVVEATTYMQLVKMKIPTTIQKDIIVLKKMQRY